MDYPYFFTARSAQDGSPVGGVGRDVRKILQTNTEEAAQGCAAEQEEMTVSDEALKKLQEQIAAWPMERRFVVQQLIRDYLRDREDLRAYEDTGLTPERCAEFARADAEGRYIVMRDAEQEGVARLRELAEADKDGRLVVLPCKMGDKLYRVFAGEIFEHRVGSMKYFAIQGRWDIETYPFCPYVERSIGKTIFLTREEAEKALEGMTC